MTKLLSCQMRLKCLSQIIIIWSLPPKFMTRLSKKVHGLPCLLSSIFQVHYAFTFSSVAHGPSVPLSDLKV